MEAIRQPVKAHAFAEDLNRYAEEKLDDRAMKIRSRTLWKILGVLVLSVLWIIASQLPSIGAALILHPFRKPVVASPPPGCRTVTFQGDGVTLEGWQGDAEGTRRGTLVYLHGVADNRTSGAGVMERFRKRGFDVVAYDSRAHGGSGGKACTYGFYEKQDLRRVLDTLPPGPIVLVGSSLGASVALQLAADDSRVTAVVAAESYHIPKLK